MILLARTSEDKHRGLTYFLAPVESALGQGVTVRPLIKMTGEMGFNEVFIEDLEISDSLRVDEVGAGWAVANTTLMHERGASALVTPGGGGVSLPKGFDAEALIALARRCERNGRPVLEDEVVRDRLMAMLIREEGLKQHVRRAQVPALLDDPMRLPMQAKLLGTEHMQALAALALEIEGQRSSLYIGDDNAPQDGRWPLSFMNSYGFTIAAGTSEVQRNLLGERVLGLPKTK
jgi:alkylation response protein AidB-like acyl-CoA dehydrogenase